MTWSQRPAQRDLAARAGGAVVMGTGIVSTGLALDGQTLLSLVLLGLTALVWCIVAAAVAAAALAARGALLEHARTPGALTWVAGTNVLGARLSLLGWDRAAAALLALAVALWLVLVPAVLSRWRTPTVGLSFLLAVATESVAVLSARLAVTDGIRWLALAALVPCALGLLFYLLVLARFDLRQLGVGAGDHWIAGGALAIAALAVARCAQAVSVLHGRAGEGSALATAALAVWAAAAAWLPALLAAELVRRRRGFDERRWSTVFPLGMYAACSFAAPGAAGIGGLATFARVWIWPAFAAWLLVAAASVRAFSLGRAAVSESKKA